MKCKKYDLAHEEGAEVVVHVFGDELTKKHHILIHFVLRKQEVKQWVALLGDEYKRHSDEAYLQLYSKKGKISENDCRERLKADRVLYEKEILDMIDIKTYENLYKIIYNRVLTDLAWVFKHPLYIRLREKVNLKKRRHKILALSKFGYFIAGAASRKRITLTTVHYQITESPNDPEVLDYAVWDLKQKVPYREYKGVYSDIQYYSDDTWGINNKRKKSSTNKRKKSSTNKRKKSSTNSSDFNWKKTLKSKMSENSLHTGNNVERGRTGMSPSIKEQIDRIWKIRMNKEGAEC